MGDKLDDNQLSNLEFKDIESKLGTFKHPSQVLEIEELEKEKAERINNYFNSKESKYSVEKKEVKKNGKTKDENKYNVLIRLKYNEK